jgi:acyl dehydratase
MINKVKFETEVKEFEKSQVLPEWTSDPIELDHLKAFADASGDQNPIHQNEEVAKKMGLPGVIAHGMLTMGFFGEYVTLLAGSEDKVKKLNCQFKAMTFLGDTVTVSGKVIKIDELDGKKIAHISLIAKNQKGEKTCQGHADFTL